MSGELDTLWVTPRISVPLEQQPLRGCPADDGVSGNDGGLCNMRKFLKNMSLCILAMAGAQVLQAEPKPATNPTSWELDFRYFDPQRVSVTVPGQSRPVVYWYMLYSVENNTGREVDFYPSFELVTDTLQVIESETQVSAQAYQAVQKRSGNGLLVPPEKASGKLRCGKEQARHSVALWRDFDPQARAFKVYVSGLSGEMIRLKNPAFDPSKPEDETNQRSFLLRKTLEIPYRLPGSPQTRADAKPAREPDGQQWVMR